VTPAALAGAGLLAAAALAPVKLRGGGVVDAPVERVSIAGVQVGGPAPRTIGWDRVRAVTGPGSIDAEAYAPIADAAWRARTRLDRGDVRGALPLLDELESRCAGMDGPTPLAVFSAALDARLRVGDQPGALRAFFELHRLIPDADDWRSHGLDDATGLPPGLPPVMTDDHAAAAPALEIAGEDSAEIAGLKAYFAAALSGDPSRLPTGEPRSNAELLLGRLCRASAGDAGAQQRLDRWASDAAEREGTSRTWRDAWAAAARARAAESAGSSESADRRRAAIAYLRLPAAFARQSPYLAGLGLARAATLLDSIGESAGAAALRAELDRVSPDHPAATAADRDTGDQRS